MMPKMDGYEFYQKFSENPGLNLTPFIFITSKSDPEDVRLAKKLGVDDYITKPFNKEDLLASVAGKIARSKKQKSLSIKISKELSTSLKLDLTPSISKEDEKRCIFVLMMWDEEIGPKLISVYPADETPLNDIEHIGRQLFQTTVSLYGQSDYFEAQGVLLRIANIERDGYLLFDTFEDNQVRGGKRQFMITVIAPRINYLESLRIKEILEECSLKIKEGKKWQPDKYWHKILAILTTPVNK